MSDLRADMAAEGARAVSERRVLPYDTVMQVGEYGDFFRQASAPDPAANEHAPPAGRQAGGEMLPRPQASLSVPDSPRRQGSAAPGGKEHAARP